MADFNQAIQWMKQGNKVRRSNWESFTYNQLSNNSVILEGDFDEAVFSIEDFEANDWELFVNVGEGVA